MHSGKCIDGAMYRSVCDSVEERSSNLALGAQHWGKAPSLHADGFFIGAPALSSCYPQCSPNSSSGCLLSLLSSPFLHSCVWLAQLPPAYYQDTTSKWFSELSSHRAQGSHSLLDRALDVSISHVSPPCPAGTNQSPPPVPPHVSQPPHPMSTWHPCPQFSFISSILGTPSVVPFSSCPQSFPPSGSFPVSWLFTSGSLSIGASASVLPMNIQGWFPLGHQLNGHEFEQTPGDSEGQGSLICCSPWGCKESDMTEQLNSSRYPHCQAPGQVPTGTNQGYFRHMFEAGLPGFNSSLLWVLSYPSQHEGLIVSSQLWWFPIASLMKWELLCLVFKVLCSVTPICFPSSISCNFPTCTMLQSNWITHSYLDILHVPQPSCYTQALSSASSPISWFIIEERLQGSRLHQLFQRTHPEAHSQMWPLSSVPFTLPHHYSFSVSSPLLKRMLLEPGNCILLICVFGEGDGTPLQYSCRPWMEEPGRLQSMGSRRVGHDWATSLYFSLSCIGEGNGNPLQCSCLENPRDGGAWWAAVYGVAQGRTRLKRLSSSSSNLHRRGSLKLCASRGLRDKRKATLRYTAPILLVITTLPKGMGTWLALWSNQHSDL